MKRLLVLCAVLLALPFMALAASVPDTGQTRCYDTTHEITCPNPGEDFYGQDAQYPGNPQSYTKLDESGNPLPDDAPWPWAMVRDNVTGLIWEVKTDAGSIHYKDNRYNWYDAQDVFIAFLNSDNFSGHNDWRLPTAKELMSIVNRDRNNPSINTTYFPNTVSSLYWSSTTRADYLYDAWSVIFRTGNLQSHDKSDDYYDYYVRAVRGVQTTNNFIDNGDGTVTDSSTGLMWQKDTALVGYTWQQALSYCENLTLASYDDWRLPDVNELLSLVDYSRYKPAIDTSFFPSTVWSDYWSSTPHANNPDLAMVVYFGQGNVIGTGPTSFNGGYVRAVRAGQYGSFGDSDSDGILDDGDNSGTPGDNPCTGGQTENCDDNCPNNSNPGQEDTDSDEVGDVCDNCPNAPNTGQNDVDHDCVGDLCDNCLNIPNSSQEDTDSSGIGNACNDSMDADSDEWEDSLDNCPNTSNPLQEDTYPPSGNGCGDACECEGDFDHDRDQDGSDAARFKAEFGRSSILNPCSQTNFCAGNFDADQDVDGIDAAKFKEDFGRSIYRDICPACAVAP